jgi:hypothetical protein
VFRTHKRSKNGTKIAHPVHFSPLLLDFVAPYWLGILPSKGGSTSTHKKKSKNGTKMAHPVHFFPFLLDFVAPDWLSVLPPKVALRSHNKGEIS